MRTKTTHDFMEKYKSWQTKCKKLMLPLIGVITHSVPGFRPYLYCTIIDVLSKNNGIGITLGLWNFRTKKLDYIYFETLLIISTIFKPITHKRTTVSHDSEIIRFFLPIHHIPNPPPSWKSSQYAFGVLNYAYEYLNGFFQESSQLKKVIPDLEELDSFYSDYLKPPEEERTTIKDFLTLIAAPDEHYMWNLEENSRLNISTDSSEKFHSAFSNCWSIPKNESEGVEKFVLNPIIDIGMSKKRGRQNYNLNSRKLTKTEVEVIKERYNNAEDENDHLVHETYVYEGGEPYFEYYRIPDDVLKPFFKKQKTKVLTNNIIPSGFNINSYNLFLSVLNITYSQINKNDDKEEDQQEDCYVAQNSDDEQDFDTVKHLKVVNPYIGWSTVYSEKKILTSISGRKTDYDRFGRVINRHFLLGFLHGGMNFISENEPSLRIPDLIAIDSYCLLLNLDRPKRIEKLLDWSQPSEEKTTKKSETIQFSIETITFLLKQIISFKKTVLILSLKKKDSITIVLNSLLYEQRLEKEKLENGQKNEIVQEKEQEKVAKNELTLNESEKSNENTTIRYFSPEMQILDEPDLWNEIMNIFKLHIKQNFRFSIRMICIIRYLLSKIFSKDGSREKLLSEMILKMKVNEERILEIQDKINRLDTQVQKILLKRQQSEKMRDEQFHDDVNPSGQNLDQSLRLHEELILENEIINKAPGKQKMYYQSIDERKKDNEELLTKIQKLEKEIEEINNQGKIQLEKNNEIINSKNCTLKIDRFELDVDQTQFLQYLNENQNVESRQDDMEVEYVQYSKKDEDHADKYGSISDDEDKILYNCSEYEYPKFKKDSTPASKKAEKVNNRFEKFPFQNSAVSSSSEIISDQNMIEEQKFMKQDPTFIQRKQTVLQKTGNVTIGTEEVKEIRIVDPRKDGKKIENIISEGMNK